MLMRLFVMMMVFAILILIISLLKTFSLSSLSPPSQPELKLAIFSAKPAAAKPAPPPPPLHASQFGGYHTTTLTHVIYTLHNQLEANALLQAIKEHWPVFPPCDNWNEIFPCNGSPAFPVQQDRPNLLILIAEQVDANVLSEVVRMSPHVARCFHRPAKIVRFTFVPESLYSMEEMLLQGDCGVTKFAAEVGYAMFVPAFSRPVQANWLSHVAKSLVFPAPLYWVVLPFQRRFPIAERNTVAVYRLSTHPTGNSRGGGGDFRCKTINSTNHEGNFTAATTTSFPQVFFSQIRVHTRNVLREKWTGVSAFSIQDQLHCFLYYFYRTEYELVRMQLASRVLITELFTSREEQAVPGVTQLVGLNATTTNLLPPVVRKKSQSDQSPHHDSWLSHVVFALPNVPSQFDRLKHTLTEWWLKFPPCRSEQDYTFLAQWQSNTCSTTQRVKKPTLVFMVSRRSFLELEAEAQMYDLKLEQKIQREVVQVLQETSTRCFSAVKICVVRFHQNVDNYITGSKVLFERFLQGECTGGKEQGDHALYIEPDARPVQAGWLSSLSSTVVYPNPPSWIVGAIFRGAESITKIPSYPKSWFFHFNGNGIYQLSRTRTRDNKTLPLLEDLKGMESFRSHYFARVRPWAISTTFWETAMDMDIMDYIFGAFHVVVNHMEWALGERAVAALQAQGTPIEQSSPPRYREHLPNAVSRFITHCRYSDMIANKYRSDWTFEEMAASGAQIVHGGFCGEACK